MNNGFFRVKDFKNEQVLDYDLNSKEMQELQAKIDEMKNNILEIPVIINGKEIRTKNTRDCILPHDKNKKIGF